MVAGCWNPADYFAVLFLLFNGEALEPSIAELKVVANA